MGLNAWTIGIVTIRRCGFGGGVALLEGCGLVWRGVVLLEEMWPCWRGNGLLGGGVCLVGRSVSVCVWGGGFEIINAQATASMKHTQYPPCCLRIKI